MSDPRESEALKPCPLCGGEAERYTVLNAPGFANRQVQCTRCGASAFDRKWNTRPTSDLEAVREACAKVAEQHRAPGKVPASDYDEACDDIATAIRAIPLTKPGATA